MALMSHQSSPGRFTQNWWHFVGVMASEVLGAEGSPSRIEGGQLDMFNLIASMYVVHP